MASVCDRCVPARGRAHAAQKLARTRGLAAAPGTTVKSRNNSNVHRPMNRQTKCGTFAQRDPIQQQEPRLRGWTAWTTLEHAVLTKEATNGQLRASNHACGTGESTDTEAGGGDQGGRRTAWGDAEAHGASLWVPKTSEISWHNSVKLLRATELHILIRQTSWYFM